MSEKFKVYYETDYRQSGKWHHFQIEARNIAEASKIAEPELLRLDQKAAWDTNTTDAGLIIRERYKDSWAEVSIPTYRYITPLPPHSAETQKELKRIEKYIERKQYGIETKHQRPRLNLDCYDFRCDGKFSEGDRLYLRNVYVSMRCSGEGHKLFPLRDRGRISFFNEIFLLEERTAEILDALRGTKENALERFERLKAFYKLF